MTQNRKRKKIPQKNQKKHKGNKKKQAGSHHWPFSWIESTPHYPTVDLESHPQSRSFENL